MIGRLKRRREFLAAAKGAKVSRRSLVVERVRRGDEGPARFGFTVSKRVAKKAVERNRIRRRLKEAVRLHGLHAAPGYDYVLVGRRGALAVDFASLGAELAGALREAPRPHGARTRSLR